MMSMLPDLKPKQKSGIGRQILAIDFDGTLCVNKYPEIGAPRTALINAVKREQANGAALILWTCRTGKELAEAVEWCSKQGLHFDAVNDNLPSVVKKFGGNSRKVVATKYIDDKAATSL